MSSLTMHLALPALLFCVLLQVMLPSWCVAAGPPDYRRLLESYAQKTAFSPYADDGMEEYAILAQTDDPAMLVVLRAGLTSPKTRVRRAAALLLGEHRDVEAVPALLGLLRDKDAGVRAQVGEALAFIGRPEAFEPVAALLSDASVEVRCAVASRLRFFGAPAYEPLVNALQDRDIAVRLAAMDSLPWLGDLRAAGPFTLLLSDADEDIREAAVEALGRLGALDPLLAALPAADTKLRLSILRAIAGRNDPRVHDALFAACLDADGQVRAQAVRFLPRTDPRTLEIVNAALRDPEPAVRRNAIYHLRYRLLTAETVDRLLPLLRDPDILVCGDAAQRLADYLHPRITEPLLARLAEPECPYWVQVALVNQGEARIIPALLALLAGWSGGEDLSTEANKAIDLLLQLGEPAVEPLLAALQSEDAGLRAGAACALGQLDDPRALPALLAALPDPEKRVRLAVLEALAEQGDVRCRDAVLPLLKAKDADIRCAAARALRFCQDGRLLPALKGMLSSRNAGERAAAVETLVTLADPRVVPLLAGALRDRDEGVRQSAIRACSYRGRDERTLEAILDAAARTDLILVDQPAGWLQSYPPEVARPVLLRRLQGKDPRRRVSVIHALRYFPAPEVTAALMAAMIDPDNTIRFAVQDVLRELADPAMLPGLVQLLDHPFYAGANRQEVLIDLLGYSGQGGADVLLKLLAAAKSGDNHDLLIQALGQTGDPRVVDALAHELHDPFSLNPYAAARALGELGDPRAITPLLEALPAANAATRALIADALGKLKAREAVEPLCRRLRDGDILPGIVSALKEIGDPRAADALLSLLDAPPDVLINNSGTALTTAVEALRQFGDPRAAAPMLALLKRCLYDGKADWLCDALIDALSILPAEQARNEAKAFLQAEHTPRAEELLRRFEPGYKEEKLLSGLHDTLFLLEDLFTIGSSLGQLRDANARERLIQLAHGDSWRARGAAAYALAEKKEAWAIDELATLLADPQIRVRAIAVLALAQARGEKVKATLAYARQHPNPDVRLAAEELQQLTILFVLTQSWLFPDSPGFVMNINFDE